MLPKSKVTVIMPVYNNKEDVSRAIQSIFDQTYSNWELIIIDDCSTDETFDTINNFINNKPFDIKFRRNPKNYGPYISTNLALNTAEGEYICRLDSDDTISPDYFESCATILDEKPMMEGVNTRFVRGSEKIERYGEITLFYRKRIIDQIGYYDSVRFGADSEFRARFALHFEKKIFYLSKVTYFATIRDNSLTTNPITRNWAIRSAYIKNYLEWHKETNIKDLYIPFPLTQRLFAADQIQISDYVPIDSSIN